MLRIQDEAEFQASVVHAPIPVLVAFTAEWCPPCTWLYPYLERYSQEAAGRFRVATVDFDRIPHLAERHRITSLPTVLLLRAGGEVERSLGVEPDRLQAMVDRATSASSSEGGA